MRFVLRLKVSSLRGGFKGLCGASASVLGRDVGWAQLVYLGQSSPNRAAPQVQGPRLLGPCASAF
jgi:hypothetical protein